MLSAIGLVLCPSSTYIGTVDEQARYMPMTLPYSNTSSMAEKEFKLNLVLNLSTTVKISRNPDQDITLTTTGHSVSISNLSYVDPYGMRSSVNLEGTCAHPEYLVFTWVLCLVSLATALKLYYLVKAIMALGMVAFYTALILFKFSTGDSFSLVQLSTLGVPLGVQMLIHRKRMQIFEFNLSQLHFRTSELKSSLLLMLSPRNPFFLPRFRPQKSPHFGGDAQVPERCLRGGTGKWRQSGQSPQNAER